MTERHERLGLERRDDTAVVNLFKYHVKIHALKGMVSRFLCLQEHLS